MSNWRGIPKKYSKSRAFCLSTFQNNLCNVTNTAAVILRGGKSTQLSYLSKSKEMLIENDSSKTESHPVNTNSVKVKVFCFKYTQVSKVHVKVYQVFFFLIYG